MPVNVEVPSSWRFSYVDDGHPTFVHPPRDAHVWRYMPFERFATLITSAELFFARADLLGDEWEGTMWRGALPVEVEPSAGPSPDGTVIFNDATAEREFFEQQRQRTFISCWHMSEHERIGMWTRFGGSVAIRSTFGRLVDALPRDGEGEERNPGNPGLDPISLRAGTVWYGDWPIERIRKDTGYGPLMHKRNIHAEERELRIVGDYVFVDRVDVDGWRVPVDLEGLIEAIYVAPGATDADRAAAESLVRQAGLSADVRPSVVDAPPPV